MNARGHWSRILLIAGLVCMVIGAFDPLEGSLLILPGAGIVAIGAFLGGSKHRKALYLSFVLVAIGVAALAVLSSFGGIRLRSGDSGQSAWWGLFVLPYPIGWIMGFVGSVLSLARAFKKGT